MLPASSSRAARWHSHDVQDPTPDQLATLDPQIRGKAITLLNGLRSVGVPAIIVAGGARRTVAQQFQLFQSGSGVTSTTKSRHIVGMAFDLDVMGYKRDAIPDWWWWTVGPWAETNLGLVWGGRWKRPYDPGHFQL